MNRVGQKSPVRGRRRTRLSEVSAEGGLTMFATSSHESQPEQLAGNVDCRNKPAGKGFTRQLISHMTQFLREFLSAPLEVAQRLTYRPNSGLEANSACKPKNDNRKELTEFHINNCLEHYYMERHSLPREGRSSSNQSADKFNGVPKERGYGHAPTDGGYNGLPAERRSDTVPETSSSITRRDPLKRTYNNMDPARRIASGAKSLVVRPHRGELAEPPLFVKGDPAAISGSYDRITAVHRWNELPKDEKSQEKTGTDIASTSGVHAALYKAMNIDTMNPHGLKQFIDNNHSDVNHADVNHGRQ